ncbi:MAG: hypothetical protein Q8P68_00155 [Candidatus Peregrinibacteria bacterium]|nr:hypothetical protein [Candidatus Peregrinibacteria bacterium]MDZ4244615.1 hypothetical protein [Candidatus Gracilibacteria bacterium]
MAHTKSSILWGIAGSIGIAIIFYLLQVLGMQDWMAPIDFSIDKWYFIAPLVIGFGIQMGLFRAIHLKSGKGKGVIAASGGVSSGAMLACCMHNLVLFLPILGLSGAAVFFATYQNYVFGISILFVLGGIAYMWKQYKKLHSCCEK